MIMRKNIILLLLMLLPLVAIAEKSVSSNDYSIQIDIPTLKNEKVFFGSYVMGKPYSNDSILLDNKGKGVIKGNEKLTEGLFLVYFTNGKYVDFLIGNDQHVTIKGDTLNLPSNIHVGGAKQSTDFFHYMRFLLDIQTQYAEKNASKKEARDETVKQRLDEEMTQLGASLVDKQNSLLATYPKGMVSVFLNGLKVPEAPDFTVADTEQNPDSVKQMLRYLFYKDHYFDNVDFADPRIYNTPYLPSSLETYLNRVLIQHPDSIIPSVVALVERSKGNAKTFQMMTSFMLNYGVKNNMMGMDKLMVELGNRYYLSGQATWADSTLVASLRKEIKKIETSLVGMQASNMYLANAKGEYTDLYSMCGEQLTILYFFEPDCGHCKKTTPLVRDFIEKYKDDNRIKVVAVYLLLDKEEWSKFIDTYQLQAFANVWDPQRVSRFWEQYDTSTTPMIYVLDKDKKIMAKKIDVETLEMIAKYELK